MLGRPPVIIRIALPASITLAVDVQPPPRKSIGLVRSMAATTAITVPRAFNLFEQHDDRARRFCVRIPAAVEAPKRRSAGRSGGAPIATPGSPEPRAFQCWPPSGLAAAKGRMSQKKTKRKAFRPPRHPKVRLTRIAEMTWRRSVETGGT